MKRIFLLFTALALALSVSANPLILLSGSPPAAGGGLPSGDIFSETFAGSNAGYDNAGWSEDVRAGCTFDKDYASNLSPQGGDSLLCIGVSDVSRADHAVTANSEHWGRMLVRWNGAETRMLNLLTGGALADQIHIDATGHLFVLDAGNNNFAFSSDAMSANTWYYIWWHFLEGSGTAVIEASFSATSTRPAYTGSSAARVTNGAVNTDVDSIRIGSNSGFSQSFQLDDFNIFSTAQ